MRVVRVVGLTSLEIAMGHLGLCGRLDAAEHVEARVVELRAVRLVGVRVGVRVRVRAGVKELGVGAKARAREGWG